MVMLKNLRFLAHKNPKWVFSVIFSLFFLMLINCVNAQCEYGNIEANATYNMSNYSCVQVRATGNENFDLILCDASSNDCTTYNNTDYLPLNTSKDYIIKVAPSTIDSSSSIVNYFTSYKVWLVLILLILLVLFISGFVGLII